MQIKITRIEQSSISFKNVSESKSRWSLIDRQVKQLEIQYQQMSAKIVEKMNCGRMQLDIISTFMERNKVSNQDHQETQHQQNSSKLQSSGSTFTSQLSQSTSTSSKCIKEQLKNQQNWLSYLQNTLKEDNQMLSQHLISKQIDIQTRKQLHLKLKNYQSRIRQLHQILVRKQMEISFLSNENYKLPKLPTVRKFTNSCIQLSNIKTMSDKYKQFSKQYMRQKNKKVDNQTQILIQITSSVENNASLPNKSRVASQNIPDQRIKQRLSKKIVKQDDIGVFNDPLFKKIIKILDKQLQREQKLIKQYNSLKVNLKNLNTGLKSTNKMKETELKNEHPLRT